MKNIGKKIAISSMEPMLPQAGRYPKLTDLATELVSASSALSARPHPAVAKQIGNLVRSMNCYYSNFIEGHNTSPRDIERALQENFSKNPKKRDLQLEAKAHIEVQQKIDFDETDYPVMSIAFICWLHHEFYKYLPESFMKIKNPDTEEIVSLVPGEFRKNDVIVGQLIPPQPDAIEAFLNRFIQAYGSSKQTTVEKIIAVAASHHRLLWIHPFLDGNGRVVRLFSYALLKQIGVGSSLWSVARGLARQNKEYKNMLMAADHARQGDYDGRGALSERNLVEFCEFFLRTCLDQINYMDDLLQTNELSARIERYADHEIHAGRLPKGSWSLLKEALQSGEFERGKAPAITGYKERQARTVLNELVKQGLLVSDSPKGPVRLGFPLNVVEAWLPKLYPVG